MDHLVPTITPKVNDAQAEFNTTNKPKQHVFGVGGNWSTMGKTYADPERTYKLHTERSHEPRSN